MNRAFDDLLDRLGTRLATGQATDLGAPTEKPSAPMTDETTETAERELGFPLPALLSRIYHEIGSEFGPGYGLLPLVAGRTRSQKEISLPPGMPAFPKGWVDFVMSNPNDVVSIYRRYRSRGWPERILPFAHWGSGIFSCLDLPHSVESDDPPVLRFEPNMTEADSRHFFGETAYKGTGLMPEAASLHEWLENWLDGDEMFKRPYKRQEK